MLDASNAIDRRELPTTLPAELRRSILLARDLRADPVTRAVAEAIVCASVGQPLGFPVGLSDADRARFEKLMADPPTPFLDAVRIAAVRISPLTCALLLGHDRRDPFSPAAHLRLVSDAIARGMSGTGPRFIIVSMPPRFGKSTLVSYRTPGFFLMNAPHLTAACLTYGDAFAESFGRKMRNSVLDSAELFGFGLAADSTSASRWNTAHGGGLWTAGVGGSITGRSADLLVLDDPIRGAAEAGSLRERDELWSIWTSTIRTRLVAGSVCVVVMTRWHSDDLVGRLLSGFEGTDAGSWLEIRLPAIWESDTPDLLGRRRGDALWPERFPISELDLTRRSVGAETWSGLYQQTPIDQTAIGRVYHAFDESNVCECGYDSRCSLFVGCDFNVDPASAVLGQVRSYVHPHPSLRHLRITDWEVLDEISIPDCNTLALASEIDSRLRDILRGYPPAKVTVYGDSSGNARRSSASESDWQIMEDQLRRSDQFYHASFDVPDSNPAVRDRVASVNGLLHSADRQVRLVIDPKCTQLLTDLRTCRWKRDSSGNSTSLIDKSDPKRTHLSDALGYAVYRRVKVGAQCFGFVSELAQ